MTNEQAVKWIKFVHDVLYEDKDEEIREAIDMAIEALSDDAVSREAHYDAVANRITDMEERGFVKVVRCKDCRWYSNNHLCEQLSRFGSIEPLADFYCAFGERREP